MKLLIFTLCAVKCFALVKSAEIPPFMKICHKSDPDLIGCLIKAIEALRPYLQTGSPEYNIPSVEPTIIKELINEDTGSVKVTTNDVVSYGGGTFIVDKLEVDLDKDMKFKVDVTIPFLRVEAKYTIAGKVLMVPIHGQGDFFANLTECKCSVDVKTENYQKDGEEYFRVVSVVNRIKISDGKIRLDNLFGGEKMLGDIINDTINKNLAIYVKEIMPYIEKALAGNFMNTANQIIQPYTLEQLFPE